MAELPVLLLVSGWSSRAFPFSVCRGHQHRPAADSLPQIRPPAGLQAVDRHAELRAGPGLAGPEGDIDTVHTGDLRHAERARATVTTAQLVPPGALTAVLPQHTYGPCTALDLHDHGLHDFPTVPLLCPAPNPPCTRPPAGSSQNILLLLHLPVTY